MASGRLLKCDAFGTVSVTANAAAWAVVRDSRPARPGVGWLARRLVRREAQALARLRHVAAVPELIACDGAVLVRTWLDGEPMHRAEAPGAAYFRAARRSLHALHRAGVTHNDLAKEANWLCRPDGSCGIVDFQVAICFDRRTRWFRLLAREDVRHLLKHKRFYVPAALTAREHSILANPAWPARLWRAAIKPVYRLVTRGLLGWQDRNSAEERGAVTDER